MKKDIFGIANTCGECGGSGQVEEDCGCEDDSTVMTDCGGCGGTGQER